MSRVTVIIPSWNGRHLLPFCLAGVKLQDEPDLDILVVDNGSTDGTASWLSRHWPQVRQHRLDRNHGFAAAVNHGLERTRRPFVLILNNDAALGPGYISALADCLAQRPQAAACQGRILRHDDPSVVDSLGIQFDSTLRAFQSFHGRRDPGSSGGIRTIQGVGACAALYRRAALVQVAEPGSPPAVFEPSFFAYYEDVDLALRLAAAGWTAHLVSRVASEHVGSATGLDGSWLKTYLLGRNYLLYLARHEGLSGLVHRAPHLMVRRLGRLLSGWVHPRREMALTAGELAALARLGSAFFRVRRAGTSRRP
ncbi:MAG: glycosyltransferase family 2 protein [Acidobacteriota bacterium]